MFTKIFYPIGTSIGVLSCFKVTNKYYLVRCTIIIGTSASSTTMYITNVFETSSKTFSTNLCLSISFTRLVVGITSVIVYFLQVSSIKLNFTSALLRDKKKISKTTSILVLVSRKIFSKNQIIPRLYYKKNLAKIIPYIFKEEP